MERLENIIRECVVMGHRLGMGSCSDYLLESVYIPKLIEKYKNIELKQHNLTNDTPDTTPQGAT